MLFEGLQLGQYSIRRLIGRGGTGDVYLAQDQKLLRQVALKIVQTDDPTSETARKAMDLFQREAQAIASLNHPNILPLFDFGEAVIGGVTLSYLVMPYCSEGSLTSWLRMRTGSLVISPHDVLHIVRQAADALEHAHDSQIIHRDVKPANFLVRSRKDTPSRPDLLLADFGVVRLAQATVNVSKTIRGTPTYMAPEQWNAKPVPASDQYSLAVMTYELLTGRPPFQGTQEQVMYQHLMVQPQPPSTFNARIPSSIDAVVLRALAKRPTDRYPSVSAFAYAFQQAVAELPPVSPSARSIGSSPSLTPPLPLVRNTPGISGPNISPPNISGPQVAASPISPLGGMGSNELHTVVRVSQAEAMAGTERLVLLAGRQPINVLIPAGVHDGQVIRLQDKVEASSPNLPKRDLVLTIAITSTAGDVSPEPARSSIPQPLQLPISEPSNPSISGPSDPSISGPAIIRSIPGLSPSRITWKTLSLIGLVLLLLLVGVVALSPLGKGLSPINAPNATATANASSATVQAAQGTATAAAATTNVGATATAQFEATATANANPYDPSMGVLKLQDPLTKNSNSGWDERSGACTFSGDGYHVIGSAQAPAVQMCIAQHPNFGDFTLQVQVKLLRGTGGILFRAGATSYYFRISKDGYYALLACAGTNCSKTLVSGYSSYYDPSKQSNVLAVVAKGTHIELYVNGEPASDVDDGTSLQGQIGVVAEAGSQVVCSDLQVWTT